MVKGFIYQQVGSCPISEEVGQGLAWFGANTRPITTLFTTTLKGEIYSWLVLCTI